MTRIMEALAARMDRVRKGEKTEGFTLIELLVVVIIIGILAAIAIPVYISVQNNAKDGAVKSDLGNLKTAEVAQYTSTGAYETADLTKLATQGYTQSDTSNYDATASAPVVKTSGNAICLQAKSASGTTFAVSDKIALAKGTCDNNAVMTKTP